MQLGQCVEIPRPRQVGRRRSCDLPANGSCRSGRRQVAGDVVSRQPGPAQDQVDVARRAHLQVARLDGRGEARAASGAAPPPSPCTGRSALTVGLPAPVRERADREQLRRARSARSRCQRATASPACAPGQVGEEVRGAADRRGSCSVRLVTMPKLPPPPPRQAQNRSGSGWRRRCAAAPSAVTIVQRRRCCRRSRPSAALARPIPPPRARPAMPTFGQEPAGIVQPAAARLEYMSMSWAPAPTDDACRSDGGG